MKQGNAVPDRAATLVVHPTPGIGDATTIADALAMLVAMSPTGGSILVREGTYPLAATITLPVGVPVTIQGVGNATVIALGANAIAAFTIPTGYTTNTPIVFDNFMVTGTEVATQTVLSYGEANSLAEIYISNMVTVGVELTINVTASAIATATPGTDDARFHMANCRIRPNATNASVILSNPSTGLPRVWMTQVEFIGDSLFAIPGGRTAPLFGKLASATFDGDVYLDGCEMSIGTGESDFATFDAINTTLWNNDPTNTLVLYNIFGSFSGLGNGNAESCSFRGINLSCSVNNNFDSCFLQDCVLTLFGAGTVISNNTYLQVKTPFVGTTFVIQVNNNDMVIHGNTFNLSTPPSEVVDLEAPCTITDNDFSNVVNGANGALFVNNAQQIITGNRFRFDPTTGPNVKEAIGANYWANNSQLFTNKTGGGPIVNPIINPGVNSTMQGMLDFNGSGAIGAGGSDLFVWYRNPYGLAMVQGYVINTGVNPYTITETYITQTEGTFTRTTTPVAVGAKVILNPYNFAGLGAIDNQVVEYRVTVSSIGAVAIAWSVFFVAPNGVTFN